MNRTSPTLTLRLAALLLTVVGAASPARAATTPAPDGINIHYEVLGAGEPTLVFVHGWSCDVTYWRETAPVFAADHRVVLVDLAEHGESGGGRTEHTMRSFAEDVVAVLDAEEVTDAILIGHSMGGPVVVETALLVPDRVRGLIGVDNFQDMGMQLDAQQIAGFLTMMRSDFAQVCAGWVRGMFPADADSNLVDAVSSDMASTAPEPALDALDHTLAWMNGGGVPRLEQLKVNLTTVSSEMHPTNVEGNRKHVPRFDVRLLGGVGHFLMLEQPEAFNALLGEAIADYMLEKETPGAPSDLRLEDR